MPTLREWVRRLWATAFPGRADEDLAEELRTHLELAAERGRRDAGAAQAMEALRDQRGLPWLDTLMRDVRYGLRVLGRSPVFTSVAILSLALGIGANAAIFQLIDALRFRTLPVAHPETLVEIRPSGPQAFGSYQGLYVAATYPLWQEIRRAQHAFSSVEAWGSAQWFVGPEPEVTPARGLWVSGGLFSLLGVQAERGRLLTVADDHRGCGAGPAVISHGFWQTRFGGAESVIGRTLRLSDHDFTIVGIAPRDFTGPVVGEAFDVALPICAEEVLGPTLDQRDRWFLTPLARLEPGWTLEQARADLQTISPGVFAATVPDGYSAELRDGYRKLSLLPGAGGRGVSRLRDTYGTSLLLLLGLTALLLLITCSNLATLLLARANARVRELVVRAALGAGRGRLVLQMVIESGLLGGAGALLALPVAVGSARALVAFLDTSLNPVALDVGADWRVLAFIAATAVVTVLVFGCIPALRMSLVDGAAALQQTSHRVTADASRARFQRALVATQIAISMVLVVAALMFVQTFRKLAAVDLGFASQDTYAIAFTDPSARNLTADAAAAFESRLTDAIRTAPGVVDAAATTTVPLSGDTFSHFFRVQGAARDAQKAARFSYVSPEYFQTLQIPRRAGRLFTAADDRRARRVAVVNESFVRTHLDGRDPIGTVIRRSAEPGFPEESLEIVGVVGDTKYETLRNEDCLCEAGVAPRPPIAYVPMAQMPSLYPWPPVVVRSNGSTAFARSIAESVRRLNPAIKFRMFPLQSAVDQVLAADRMTAWLAGGFGVLALVLVMAGLYGLIAYLTVGRTNEIGIRLSLGSTRSQIVGLVVRDAVWMIAIGIAAGIPLSLGAMEAAKALLFGLSPTDPRTVVAALTGLAAAAALAGAVPAWRASRLDPNVVLRAE